jgi:hypothetical protein
MQPLKSAICAVGLSSSIITEVMDEACSRICSCINKAPLRKVPLTFPQLYTIIFTDGACEGLEHDYVTCGAVVHEVGNPGTWHFHLVVPQTLVAYWKTKGDKEQVISEAELFPVLIVRSMLEASAVLSLLVLYIDNDGVGDSLIKGFSNVACLQSMLRTYVDQELALSVVSYVARVPSPSNPADAPSRSSLPCNDGYDRGIDRSLEALIWDASYTSSLT